MTFHVFCAKTRLKTEIYNKNNSLLVTKIVTFLLKFVKTAVYTGLNGAYKCVIKTDT